MHIPREMAGKLRTSRFLAGRGPDSPPLIIAVHKVENLSSDIISQAEQWYMVQKVKNSLPLAALSREKNIVFTMPAEHVRGARERGTVAQDFAKQRKPTHVMSATILSATRAAGRDRTDLYYCEYAITDLSTGEIVWADKFEFKRLAHGKSYN